MKIFLVTFCFLLWTFSLEAETIKLVTGKIVQGEIVEKSSREMKVKTATGVVVIPLSMVDTGQVKRRLQQPIAVYRLENETPAPQSQGHFEAPRQGKRFRPEHKNVEVFVTSWCPYCVQLERQLKQKGIGYERIDVETEMGSRRFRQINGNGVPVVKIGSKIIRGLNYPAIFEELGL